MKSLFCQCSPTPLIGRRRRGFTLLEVLVAVAILGVVASTLMMIRNNAVVQSEMAYNMRIASTLARQKLHEIVIGGRPPVEGSESGRFDDFDGFSYTVDVSTRPVGVGTAREVRLTVEYPTTAGPQELVLVSLFSVPREFTSGAATDTGGSGVSSEDILNMMGR